MKNLSIGTRLLSTFGAMLVLALGIGVLSLTSMSKIVHRLETATGPSAKKLDLANKFNTATSDMLVQQRGVYIAAFQNDKARLETSKASLRQHTEHAENIISQLEPLLVTEKGKRLTANLRSLLAKWLESVPEVERLAEAGDGQGAAKLGFATSYHIYEEIGRQSEELVATNNSLLEQEKQAAESETSASLALIWGGIALTLVLAVGVFVTIRNLSRELRVATGELNEMANQVAGAAGQVAAASQTLAQGASEQAASLEETSASSEELTSMTHRNTENTVSAADLMTGVDGQVAEANRTLEQMVTSMNEINASADKIARIIKVIDEIAFQTNILALNAAVEAARAGDAGMGFAVVADEVRNLAQRCAQAARDTAQLIEESITRSGEGKQRLTEVAAAITRITTGAAQVHKLIHDVSSGSREQSAGIDQISKAVAQMERVTQSSAATAEESAASSEELSAMAEAMKSTATRLSALVGTDDTQSALARR